MTNDEAIKLLESKGYEAYIDKGCVMICTRFAEDCDVMTQILLEAGFQGSYGWKLRHEAV